MTDIAEMLRSLDLTRADALPDLSALTATYAPGPAQASFWNALLADVGFGEGGLKSRPGRLIELYADAVARHAASKAIALSVLDARGDFRHLSFAELDSAATACSAAWAREGLEPGQRVALALPMGVSWLIAFAAALRLGLSVSCLGSSWGEQAMQRRLHALDPKRIVFDPAGPAPLAAFAARALAIDRASASHAPPPRGYAPTQIVIESFSSVREPVDQPSPVNAETALLWALRDARFAYRVGPNLGLALPGFSHEQHQPAAILATLLAGARYVELPTALLQRAPFALARPFITTLGVSPALRDALRHTPAGPLPDLRGWLRSIDEPLDWTAWQDFVEKNALGGVPAGNLLIDAASGGALLISTRRSGLSHAFALPSPGVPFALSDLNSRAASVSESGAFQHGIKPDPKVPAWFLLVKRGPEYLYGGTLSPRRAGRVYSEPEVVECVSGLAGVDGACVVPVASNEPGSGWCFVLLVFVGAVPESAHAALAREAELAIRTRLGADFLPDRTLVFPVHARREGDKLDVAWCRRQYFTGFLQRKGNLPVFRRLTALRAALKESLDHAVG